MSDAWVVAFGDGQFVYNTLTTMSCNKRRSRLNESAVLAGGLSKFENKENMEG